MTHPIVYIAIGFITGGAAGGYLASMLCTREAKRTIEALKETNASLVKENRQAAEKGLLERERALESDEKKVDKSLKKQKNKVSKKIVVPEDEVEDILEADEIDEPDDLDDTPPDEEIGLMNEGDFRHELSGFRDSECLTYYEEDGVLVDQSDRVIRHPDKVIGKEGMEALGDPDRDYLYVNNQIDGVLYEVEIDRKYSYYRDILGQG